MENVQTYIVVRDTDLDSLTDAVNERIDEGYELAGPLLCVPGSAKEPPLFVQPLTLAVAEEEEEEDEESEDEDYEEDEEGAVTDDVATFRRR